MNTNTHQQFIRIESIRRALTIGLGAQLIAFPAIVAQDNKPADTDEAETVEMTMTGTRLTGAEAEGSLSVSPYNLDKPIYQGYSSPAEMLRQKLPQFGGGTGTANDSFGNAGDGSVSISLRGLPLSRTLILVNGRRLISGDLNLIPQGAIERIEVLNDGASPIYGSDAVAGVVNIITKQKFDGFQIGMRYGNTTEADISERRVWATWGQSSEKGNITLSAEYNKANGQYSPDRGVSYPAGDSVSGTSNPGTFMASGLPDHFQPLQWSLVPGRTAGLTNATQIPSGFNPTAFVDVRIPNGAGGFQTNPDGSFKTLSARDRLAAQAAEQDRLNALLPANSPVRYGASPSLLPGVNPGFPFDLYTVAVRPFERYGTVASADRKLFGENLEAFANGSFSQNNSVNQLAPSPLSGRAVTPANYWYGTVFPGLNANSLNFTYRPVEIGPRITTFDWEEIRLVAGLRGRIAESTWKWELAYTYDRARLDQTQSGGVLRNLYDASLADPTAAGAFNPFGVTPLFGSSPVNSTALLNSFSGSASQQDTYGLQMFDANIGGEVFDLPGGPIQVSGGYEHRHQTEDLVPDFALLNNSVFPFNADSVFRGTRNVDSGFGEINIPLAGKDFNIPGVHSFSVSVAGRYESFSDVGNTGFKPRVAFRWEALEKQLVFRGSYAQGFVAPSLRDLDAGSPQQSFQELDNPLTGVRKQPTDGVVLIGNPSLKPSESDSYLVGTVYSPDYLKGFSIGANYYRIEESGIPFESAQYIVNQWYANGDSTNPNNPFGPNAVRSGVNPMGAQVSLEANGDLKQVTNIGPINTGQRVTDGIDLFATYELPTEVGTFTFSASATRVIGFEQEDFPGSGKVSYNGYYWGDGTVLGNYGFPKWKSSTSIAWEWDRYSAAIGWNFVDGYKEIGDNNRPVGSYNTYDLRLGYKIHKIDADLSFGINNLFDEQPEYVTTGFVQWDRAVTDIRGRQYFMQLSKTF
jgi:iron complex outermembrane receptor protein